MSEPSVLSPAAQLAMLMALMGENARLTPEQAAQLRALDPDLANMAAQAGIKVDAGDDDEPKLGVCMRKAGFTPPSGHAIEGEMPCSLCGETVIYGPGFPKNNLIVICAECLPDVMMAAGETDNG